MTRHPAYDGVYRGAEGIVPVQFVPQSGFLSKNPFLLADCILLQQIASWNNIKNVNLICAGQKLTIYPTILR